MVTSQQIVSPVILPLYMHEAQMNACSTKYGTKLSPAHFITPFLQIVEKRKYLIEIRKYPLKFASKSKKAQISTKFRK